MSSLRSNRRTWCRCSDLRPDHSDAPFIAQQLVIEVPELVRKIVQQRAVQQHNGPQLDVVILSHALDRVADDRKLLSEVQRLLKPEAALLLQSPYEGQQNRELPSLSSEGAKRTYCLSGLHQLLHESGFDIVTTPLYPSGVVGYDWFQLFHCVKRRGRPA